MNYTDSTILLNTLELYHNKIKETKKTFEEYKKIKNNFDSLEFDIIQNTDFNELYGRNNDKVRKEHIKRELQKEFNEVQRKENELLDNERMCDYYKLKIETLLKIL